MTHLSESIREPRPAPPHLYEKGDYVTVNGVKALVLERMSRCWLPQTKYALAGLARRWWWESEINAPSHRR